MAEEEIDGIEITDANGKVVRIIKVPEWAENILGKLNDLGVNYDTKAKRFNSKDAMTQNIETNTRLQRAAGRPTLDQALWAAIRDRTNAIGFARYDEFIKRVLCPDRVGEILTYAPAEGSKITFTEGEIGIPTVNERFIELNSRPGILGVDAYQLLKLATQAFLLFEAGVVLKGERNAESGIPEISEKQKQDEEVRGGRDFESIKKSLESYLATGNGQLPYLDRISHALATMSDTCQSPFSKNIIQHRLQSPSMLELIWSYWQEEGMLVQTMNAIALRFQNKKRHAQDPLANLTLDPLRPLNNIVWGFIQDENNRLSVQRRAYEYDSQYGITLVGKAVPRLESADSRAQFIGAFHNLLYRTSQFYREDDDTTVIADAFALLNTIREVHVILAEGAHNQFGDLPWTARHEMLLMQWMLARPEMKEFLRGRYSVPYQEPWMGAVDDMKRLQGWTDTSTTHFRELAVTGEQILLSIRYGDWIAVNDQEQARNWARSWRPEIQRYMHAYQAVSGVDLTAESVNASSDQARYAQPSKLLQQRQVKQQPSLGNSGGARLLNSPKQSAAPALTGNRPSRLRLGRDD